jgi:hypothetical protein
MAECDNCSTVEFKSLLQKLRQDKPWLTEDQARDEIMNTIRPSEAHLPGVLKEADEAKLKLFAERFEKPADDASQPVDIHKQLEELAKRRAQFSKPEGLMAPGLTGDVRPETLPMRVLRPKRKMEE